MVEIMKRKVKLATMDTLEEEAMYSFKNELIGRYILDQSDPDEFTEDDKLRYALQNMDAVERLDLISRYLNEVFLKDKDLVDVKIDNEDGSLFSNGTIIAIIYEA